MTKEKNIRHAWLSPKKINEKINEWKLRLFFIRLTDELIDLVKPKLIVCQGKQAFHDFTYSGGSKGKISHRTKNIKGRDYKVIGFSRSGNWSSVINELAKEIVSHS